MSNRTHLHYLRTKLAKLWFNCYLKVFNTKDKSPLEFLTEEQILNHNSNAQVYEWPIISNSK